MKLKTLGALALCMASTQVLADKEYWLGTDGEYARGRDGKCVRTILWTPEAAIAGCEGTVAKAKTNADTETKVAEPIASEADAEAVVIAKTAEPKYTNLSLSSGATFELGGSTLSAEGKAAVLELMDKFKGEDVKSVVISGYTDNTGDASFNQHLSEKRAEAVKATLVDNGAKADKITTKGYGEANPIADNNTRDGRGKNRRVEIQVDSKTRQL